MNVNVSVEKEKRYEDGVWGLLNCTWYLGMFQNVKRAGCF